jgi:hypothetical protein
MVLYMMQKESEKERDREIFFCDELRIILFLYVDLVGTNLKLVDE